MARRCSGHVEYADSRRRLISGLALAPAGANVIMQLSRLPIDAQLPKAKSTADHFATIR